MTSSYTPPPDSSADSKPNQGSPNTPTQTAEPSGYTGGNPATAGPGPTQVRSGTPENAEGHLDPSAPEDSNTTPGTTGTK